MMDRDAVELVCKEVVELVTDYLAGALSPGDRARLEHHLVDCPPCTEYLAQVRATMALARGLASPAVPPAEAAASADADADDLMSLFRRWRDRL